MTTTQFFYRNAGFSYNPKMQTKQQGHWASARSLAQAEAWAQSQGLIAVWQFDVIADASFVEDWTEEEQTEWNAKDHEALGCILYRPCPDHGTDCKHAEHLQSLWGIFDPTEEYKRVIEAELALETMPEQAGKAVA